MSLTEPVLETTRTALRELDLSSVGLDLARVPDEQLDAIATTVADAVTRSSEQPRPELPPEPPVATYEPGGVAACPRCHVYRGVETIRPVDDGGDTDEACFVCVPPTRRERRAALERAAELAEQPDETPSAEPDLDADGAQLDEQQP